MALKDNLKRLRENAGYKQAKEFAKAAGIPYSSYAVYERGSWPNEANLTKIASTLHVSMDELLGYSVSQEDEWKKCVMHLKAMGITDIEIVDDLDDIAISIPNNPGMKDSIKIATIYTSKKALMNIVKIVDEHFIKESAQQYQRLFYWYLSTKYNFTTDVMEDRYHMAMSELLLRRAVAKGKDKEKIDDTLERLERLIESCKKKKKDNAVEDIHFVLVEDDYTNTRK